MAENIFAYDRILYPDYLHAQTHPDRLATMAKFFGMKPKPVENCRVLELGCGTGSSLLSFAFDLPDSEFVGVDLSHRHIERGQAAVTEIGLKNLTLRQADLMDLSRAEYGEFDYIIAHGLYSWTPEAVRDRILRICRETLAEQGVAFVSYNAFPGCHFRQITRDLMMFHTKNLSEPVERVEQGLGILKFVAESISPDEVHYPVMRKELETLTKRKYENIFHDDLEKFSHPVYFHEFAAHARTHDLQFVTESEYFTGKNVEFPKETHAAVSAIADDVIAYEQYFDFISFRRFRQTLLCRKEIKISRQPDSQTLRGVRIVSNLRARSETPELANDKNEVFTGEKNQTIEINHRLTKAALVYLGRTRPRSKTFDEIVRASRRLLSEEAAADFAAAEQDEQILTEILFQIFSSGMLQMRTREPDFTTQVGEKPVASPVARWQAANAHSISTLLCASVLIEDALGRKLVTLLDGTRDRERLIVDLTEFIDSAEFDQPTEIKAAVRRELPEQLEKNLDGFAQIGLLLK